MKCPSCEVENVAGRKFCVECGAKLPMTCEACGTPHAPAEKFCGECGAELKGVTGLGPIPVTPTPLSYTPKHLADKILTSRSALEGDDAGREGALRQARGLFETMGAPLRVEQVEALLAG